MPTSPDATPDPARSDAPTTERRIAEVKRRLIREATQAVNMLEEALTALWALDVRAARAVRQRDDTIDTEEVAIEQECYAILSLRAPYARNFRILQFVLKTNADIERVADHACSIAKAVVRIADATGGRPPAWPTALVELGQRVPARCHDLLRAVLDEDTALAKTLVAADETIDRLDRQLFSETIDLMKARGQPADADLMVGMLIYRVGRELERVGDLMASVAEDVVYLDTGSIIRHSKRQLRRGA